MPLTAQCCLCGGCGGMARRQVCQGVRAAPLCDHRQGSLAPQLSCCEVATVYTGEHVAPVKYGAVGVD
jgi:hypothetical protein